MRENSKESLVHLIMFKFRFPFSVTNDPLVNTSQDSLQLREQIVTGITVLSQQNKHRYHLISVSGNNLKHGCSQPPHNTD